MQYAKRDSGTEATDFFSAAGHSSSQTKELTMAAAEVVWRRMTLGGLALVNPRASDHAEFARMVPEKTQAFSDAGSILFNRSAQIGQEIGQLITDEMKHVAQTATSLLTTLSPISMITAQADAGIFWAARLATLPRLMGLLAMEAQAASLAPIHRAATDNVERLRNGDGVS